MPVTTAQTLAVERLARRCPSCGIVVDHLGSPAAGHRGVAALGRPPGRLAAVPGVAVKVSVGIDALTAWERWDAEALKRYVAAVIDGFAPARTMLASNWPVVLLRSSYADAWRDLTGAVAAAGVAGADRAAVLGVRPPAGTGWRPPLPMGRPPARAAGRRSRSERDADVVEWCAATTAPA